MFRKSENKKKTDELLQISLLSSEPEYQENPFEMKEVKTEALFSQNLRSNREFQHPEITIPDESENKSNAEEIKLTPLSFESMTSSRIINSFLEARNKNTKRALDKILGDDLGCPCDHGCHYSSYSGRICLTSYCLGGLSAYFSAIIPGAALISGSISAAICGLGTLLTCLPGPHSCCTWADHLITSYKSLAVLLSPDQVTIIIREAKGLDIEIKPNEPLNSVVTRMSGHFNPDYQRRVAITTTSSLEKAGFIRKSPPCKLVLEYALTNITGRDSIIKKLTDPQDVPENIGALETQRSHRLVI
jgi:hypothetical protein